MNKFFLILPLLILFSCSVQKRKYQGGYYVDWNHKKKNQKEKIAESNSETVAKQKKLIKEESLQQTYPQNEDVNTISVSQASELSQNKSSKNLSFYLPPEDSCDVLIFKDGSEIKGKVKEVGITEIKYKRCDTPDGPMYISRKSELFMVKYSNGTREVIKAEPTPEPVRAAPPGAPSYRQQKYRKEIHPLALASLIFGILSIILGYACIFMITYGFGLGVFLLPIAAGLTALISGKSALRRIKEQPDLFKGKGLAIPGLIMGSIMFGIFAFICLIILVLVI